MMEVEAWASMTMTVQIRDSRLNRAARILVDLKLYDFVAAAQVMSIQEEGHLDLDVQTLSVSHKQCTEI